MAKKEKKCSMFEEMLMWTSYRYAIGRKTYVSSLAHEIPQHFYHKLSKDRRQFTSEDIRKEIYDHMRFFPVELDIRRMFNEDELNPIKALLEFIDKYKIESLDELIKYSTIQYDAHKDEYKFEKKTPTINSYFSVGDIDDLIPWETFASCFDEKNHVFIGDKEYFKTYHKKLVPVLDKPGYYLNAGFGWEPIWMELNDFLDGGSYPRYTTDDDFKKLVEKSRKELD